MRVNSKEEALELIKGELEEGYIDFSSTYDETEIEIIKKAIEMYENRKDYMYKNKIIKKIRTLEELKIDNLNDDEDYSEYYIEELEHKIEVLEELLEE